MENYGLNVNITEVSLICPHIVTLGLHRDDKNTQVSQVESQL